MRLFVFGLGYSALAFIRTQGRRFSAVSGTVSTPDKAERLLGAGISALVFGGGQADPAIEAAVASADVVIVSVPPDADGDPVLNVFAPTLAAAPHIGWVGYLSTIGVYGDHGGAWVDEDSRCAPESERSRQRLAAERAWLDLGKATGKPVHIFRLAGIYGPGRNALIHLAQGTARRIVKPGQVFNRIHVDDIARVLMASIEKPRGGAIYNVADDEPAPPQDVVAFAAGLAGVEPPPEISFEEAALSPMAASFYGECKQASNRRIRSELGVTLQYPSYRDGLRALRELGEGPQAA